MRLDRFFLPRIVIQCIQAVKDNIDAVVTDKQYAAYKKARRKHTDAYKENAVNTSAYYANMNYDPKTHNRKADSGKKYNRANGIIYKAGSGEHSTRTYGSNKGSIIKREDNGGYVISSCEAGEYDYRDYNYYNKGSRSRNRTKEEKSPDNSVYINNRFEKDDIYQEYSTEDNRIRKAVRRDIAGKCMAVMIFIAIYLLVPTIITMRLTGVVDTVVSEEITDGKTVTVSYKNATQSVDVEKFIAMVLADRLYMGDEVELPKAESIMIRTDIYRMMGEQMNIDCEQLGMSYLTTSQMKKKWSKDYSDNYNLINDCVAATNGMTITYNGQYIDARYTYISAGSTLSGQEMLGENYAYLTAVECPKDKEAEGYLVVKTISSREFINAFEKMYDGLSLSKKDLDKQVQTVSASKEGYVSKMQVGNIVMTGSTFARILGLDSSDFKLEYMDSGIKVTTIGAGDGMGVSVYTAQNMAKEGASYEDILKTFYSGVSIGESA